MSRDHHYFVYIMTNKNNEHEEKLSYHNSFTKKYNIDKLVYCETFQWIQDAIAREKQIKGGSRANKIALIEKMNPAWRDLYDEVEL